MKFLFVFLFALQAIAATRPLPVRSYYPTATAVVPGPASPADIAGLQLWLKSDTGVTVDGSNLVSAWADQSGQAHHGAASGTTRPLRVATVLNGYPVIRFDAVNDVLDFGDFMAGSSGVTIMVVWRKADGDSKSLDISKHGPFEGSPASPPGELIFQLSDDASTPSRQSARFLVEKEDASFGLASKFSIAPNNSYQISTVSWTGSAEPEIFQNLENVGAITSSGWADLSALPTTTDTWKIGTTPGFSTASGGDVAEVLVYDSKLSTVNRMFVEEYLKKKYWTTQIIVDGNSISSGQLNVVDANHNYRPWPTQMVPLLTGVYSNAMILNVAVIGQTTTQMAADAATQIDSKYETTFTKNILVGWEDSNERYSGSVSAAQSLANTESYFLSRKAVGWTTVGSTTLPRSDAGLSGGWEAARITFNSSMRSGSSGFLDALYDPALDTDIGDAGDELDTTWYRTDKVHPRDAGAEKLAVAFAGKINPL